MSYKVERGEGWREFNRFRSEPLKYVSQAARAGVDVRCMRFGPRQVFQINHPDLVRDVLITHDWNFIKGRGLQQSKPVLGEGLLTSEGELHRHQRRLVQPAFHSARLAAYARTMVGCAEETREAWAEGQVYEINREMARLTLQIVGKTLFSADLKHDAAGVGESMGQALKMFLTLNSPLVQAFSPARKWIEKRAREGRKGIEAVLGRVIEEHRRKPEAFDDMLSMLMQSRDESAAGVMSDELLMDESLTLFLAGHETTANALTWAWYLLAMHPEVGERMRAELRQVLGGRAPAMEDLEALPYTGWVFLETLRLYPPAWMIGRQALTKYALGEVEVPAGGTVLMSPYAMHRDARYWERAEEFLPERWKDDVPGARPKFTFFPFGAGRRVCIGEHFARMEGVLLLATLAQQWRMELEPGQVVVPRPRMTLRPKESVRMRARKIAAAS